MQATFTFEKLEAWHKARNLVKTIYQVTKPFPKEELFGLTNQLRRASVSIASNLAEGGARPTNKDRAHFTAMPTLSRRSAERSKVRRRTAALWKFSTNVSWPTTSSIFPMRNTIKFGNKRMIWGEC